MVKSGFSVFFKRTLALSGNDQPGDFLYLLLFALCYGAYFLLVTVAMYMPGKVIEKEEFLIYVQGWISVPILTLLAVGGVRTFKQRFFAGAEYFYPVLLGITVLNGLIFAFCLDLTWQATKNFPLILALVIAVVVLFAVLQVLGLWLLCKYHDVLAAKITFARIQLLNRLLPFGLILIAVNFLGVFANYDGFKTPLITLVLVSIGALLIRFQSFLFDTFSNRKVSRLVDILTVVLMGLACFDPLFSSDYLHQNFFLGPVNALLHGGTMLVDVVSQYGIANIEFLSLFFQLTRIPMIYHIFSVLNGLLTVVQFAMVYFIMRMLFKSLWYALLGLAVVLILNFFATIGFFQNYPSIGPLRFGLSYGLLCLILLRWRYPGLRSFLLILEYGIFGLASIWSFESFVYVAAVFMVCLLYQTLLEGQTLRLTLRRILGKMAAALLSVLLFQTAQALYIFMRTGQWPAWSYYFNYIFSYTADGLGALPIDPWSPWFFLAAIYFVGIMSIVLRWMVSRRLDGSLAAQTVLYLSIMGITQFTYFIGRSHPNNLFHICAPAVIIAMLGFQAAARLNWAAFTGFVRSSAYLFGAGILLILALFGPAVSEKIPHTAFSAIQSIITDGANFDLKNYFRQEYVAMFARDVANGQIEDTINLIRKYAPDQPRVTVLITPKGVTQALLMTKKAQVYPISEIAQDSISTQMSQAILNSPNPLQLGDVIFLASDPDSLRMTPKKECFLVTSTTAQCNQIELQFQVVQQICSRFGLTEIEFDLPRRIRVPAHPTRQRNRRLLQ